MEVDGFGAHSSPEQHEHDLDRQNMLMELGWEIRRFTASQVRRHPELVRSDLIRFVNKPVRDGRLPILGKPPPLSCCVSRGVVR